MNKNTTSPNKITLIEGICLVLLFACYIASLYFIVINNRSLLILFFILHSCLSIIFVLILHDKMTRQALQQKDNNVSQFKDELEMLSKCNEEIATLKKERDSLLLEKEQLSSKYADAEKQISTLTDSLAEEKKNREVNTTSGSLSHLLPQDETPVQLDIIAAANRVIDEMSTYSRQSGINILLSSASDRLIVRADASFIRIMFRNIIDNSIKYMNRNGSLVITISNIGDDLFIVLKDNGDGLPTNETAHIFELNYQGSNRVSGNGLGLTQAKAIVEYYGGTIYAKSEPGKGMGIYIQLPTNSR